MKNPYLKKATASKYIQKWATFVTDVMDDLKAELSFVFEYQYQFNENSCNLPVYWDRIIYGLVKRTFLKLGTDVVIEPPPDTPIKLGKPHNSLIIFDVYDEENRAIWESYNSTLDYEPDWIDGAASRCAMCINTHYTEFKCLGINRNYDILIFGKKK